MSSAPKLLAKVMVFNSVAAFLSNVSTAVDLAFMLASSASVSAGEVAGLAIAGLSAETFTLSYPVIALKYRLRLIHGALVGSREVF